MGAMGTGRSWWGHGSAPAQESKAKFTKHIIHSHEDQSSNAHTARHGGTILQAAAGEAGVSCIMKLRAGVGGGGEGQGAACVLGSSWGEL